MNQGKIIELERIINQNYSNIVGVVVIKHGEVVYQSYFNEFTSQDTVHCTSVTKSITSALIGIAIDKGYIKSVHQKVLEFFLDYKPKRGEKTMQNVTIKNMLTMTAPYKYKSEPYTKVYTSDDWTKAALDLLGGRVGITSEFKYSTVGTQILSGILTSATGKSVMKFATENLFKPLGIKAPHNTIIQNKEEHLAFIKGRHARGWVVDPKGVNTAGWGLTLTPVDMAKIGQLYLRGGTWNSKQVISTKWIEESTTTYSKWNKLSYGYLWWIVDEIEHCYAALGDGGNVIYVNTKNDVVVSIASYFKPNAKDRIELIKNILTLS